MKTRPLSFLQLDLLQFLLETEEEGRPAPYMWAEQELEARTVYSLEDRRLIERNKAVGFVLIPVTAAGERALLEGRSPPMSQLRGQES